ncbi:uncharacterized protein [Anoplolepis gracilipes]|uniref:uncharacterized protein n=1 Tax=Anoplolepis gracilipes TaxID=354296 RepID=UPI003BA2AB20
MNEKGNKIMLPRVADLERSVQWTSLANDIDNLEKCHRADDRPVVVTRTIERHTYQRGSIPEMQRACTVHCDDDHDALSQRDPDSYPEDSRWSWKPRTDFEREYFYKDYKDYYCGDSGGRFESPVYEISTGDRTYPQEEARRPYGSPVVRFSSSARHPVGLEKEHLSDSRDRLHEIFEHNRYLRRQFFAETSTTGNGRQDCNGLPSRNLGKNNRTETSRNGIGFGSTETLTSQSNQSSMSSINDRKSRTQTTRTPEEEEEENALVEFARRNNVVRHRKFNVSSSRVDRKSDVHVRRDGKVLVNILPGNEIRRVDVKDVPAINLEGTNNERNEVTRNAKCEQRMFDSWCYHETDLERRRRNLPEYIFGGDTKMESRRDGTLPSSCDKNGGIRRDLCKSLPNLTIQKQKNHDSPLYVARAVNVPEERSTSNDYGLDSHIARSGHGSGQCREQRSGRGEGRTRLIGCGQSTSQAMTVSPKRLIPPSKTGTARVPPPLDLSMVNEQCERMEADERRYLNDYSVDVTILRSHEELMKDLLTGQVAENGQWDPVKGVVVDNRDRRIDHGPPRNHQFRRRNDGRRLSFLRKSCGDLRSPQLVNDCKSFTSDPRMTVDPVRIHRRPIDPDASRRDRRASPLFDQTSPIGGPQAAGSTLPTTVYGPIPYSQ